MCEFRTGQESLDWKNLQQLRGVKMSILPQGLVDVAQPNRSMLCRNPEHFLDPPKKLLNRLVRIIQTRTEREEIGTCTVDKLRVVDVRITPRCEIVNQCVFGAAQLGDQDRVGSLEDGGGGDAELDCGSVNSSSYLEELEAICDRF